MLGTIAKKLFGSANERLVRSLQHEVDAINALEPEFAALTDDQLRAKTDELRMKATNGVGIDKLLVPAFAIVREASKRTLGLRHFDVQLIGGIVQHKGMISEMKTGEGKTLVATLSAYLNALTGKGVHIVTVNDYLARRDAEWMGKIFNFLGLTVGVIHHGLDDNERQEAYNCDITYATNNELGFDYLRDNMKYSREEMVQRPFNFAIIDEVDSILVDEARTPLIISGPTEDNSELYKQVNRLIPKISEADYDKDEKSRSVTLNDQGVAKIEELLVAANLMQEGTSLYDIANVQLVHHVNQALKAHVLFRLDTDYIVKDDKVIIIDEFTGRMMEGRRYSEGLHQALEAKEGVSIQNENQTLASITFQNYFRLYPKLAGMTGTAMTEAAELNDIYRLDVVEIPTNVPVARKDMDDEIYRTGEERDTAVVALIKECHARKQPVLVGTVSIEKSEDFSKRLKKEKIPHQVLNARYHEQEAYIIAQAGRPGAVTIATNMAGRGTDIKLGGNAELRIKQELGETHDEAAAQKIYDEVARDKEVVREAGGLFVIATERHESRRIDNQLRGRSGRQGDPGASKFFLSLQDDLMRIFGSERIDSVLQKLGLKEGEAIFHPWMNKAIERAQTKVEQRNYEMRKTLLKFDDVMNDQRKVIYEQRIELMEAENVHETVEFMRVDVNEQLVGTYIPKGSYAEGWDPVTLQHELFRIYGLALPVEDWAKEEGIADEEILERLNIQTKMLLEEKAKAYPETIYAYAEKRLLMQTLDQLWKDHLLSLDHLRQGINLRAYAQRDPLNEYKQEAFGLFEHMLNHMREVMMSRLSRMQLRMELDESMMRATTPKQKMVESRQDPALAQQQSQNLQRESQFMRTVKPEERVASDPNTWGKVARNEPCPCKSGKKFKHCHGQLA
ncbi:MAG: preprotein translocase subunit SecA [Alphaproteobacteria bacterium]|nr:preprotein translocase subunit SecA [Alphaproteobacteria bacterium]